jgi:hypothetical protein
MTIESGLAAHLDRAAWVQACLEDMLAAWDGAGRGLDMVAMNEAAESAREALAAVYAADAADNGAVP